LGMLWPEDTIEDTAESEGGSTLSCDVALETTVIAHGLPAPHNLQTALSMEQLVRSEGATPRTIGIVDGNVVIGLSQEQIEFFATASGIMKAATSEIPVACALGADAATTVSATIRLASDAGISVMCTGGIGGVHRDVPWDVSQDIFELSRTTVLVVCSGVKSILNMGKTIEFLETFGVTVIGYRTDRFPAFYSRKSPYSVAYTVSTPKEAAMVLVEKKKRRLFGSVLLLNPIPEGDEIPFPQVQHYVEIASKEAVESGVSGKALTPYLLKRLNELSEGMTLRANVSLLKNNAALAGQVAKELQNAY